MSDLNGCDQVDAVISVDLKSKSLTPSPIKQSSLLKRPHDSEISSKFNRSCRKSDHHAVYYFKHSDTEPENGVAKSVDCSSQDATSDVLSDDDQWIYSNGNDDETSKEIDVINGNVIPSIELMNVSTIVANVDGHAINEIDEKNGNVVETTTKKHYSKEEIQKLVLDAECLVREELKTPPRLARAMPFVASSRRKDSPVINPKHKFVEKWLQTQPQNSLIPPTILTTDGEASCECTESDSAARDSDASDGVADSIATCLPGAARSISQTASTEVIGVGSSTDHLKEMSDNNCPPIKVAVRQKRRNSERPWSVSCISQLTQQKPINRSAEDVNNQGLANHSISESALHKLNNPNVSQFKSVDSKNSLRRRRMRSKKKQRSESGSNASETSGVYRRNSNSSLIKSESFSGRILLSERKLASASIPSEADSDENGQLPKPNFQLGAPTSNVFANSQLGALATLAFFDGDKITSPRAAAIRESSYTGTEDNSNQSEQQVWDDYQEKYMSEAYSEGMDSEAARKLLEFGDDYRNFLDSQSDCCSSLSAANNLDSLSPPRYRKQLINSPANMVMVGAKSSSRSPEDENTMRRRRALELEIERRRRNFAENHRKSSAEGESIVYLYLKCLECRV